MCCQNNIHQFKHSSPIYPSSLCNLFHDFFFSSSSVTLSFSINFHQINCMHCTPRHCRTTFAQLKKKKSCQRKLNSFNSLWLAFTFLLVLPNSMHLTLLFINIICWVEDVKNDGISRFKLILWEKKVVFFCLLLKNEHSKSGDARKEKIKQRNCCKRERKRLPRK